jgi:hypothetical protein
MDIVSFHAHCMSAMLPQGQALRYGSTVRTTWPCLDPAERYDYAYARIGTAPLPGQRLVSVRERRTTLDWATASQYLLEVPYPEAARLRLVCDQLPTHGRGSLYGSDTQVMLRPHFPV